MPPGCLSRTPRPPPPLDSFPTSSHVCMLSTLQELFLLPRETPRLHLPPPPFPVLPYLELLPFSPASASGASSSHPHLNSSHTTHGGAKRKCRRRRGGNSLLALDYIAAAAKRRWGTRRRRRRRGECRRDRRREAERGEQIAKIHRPFRRKNPLEKATLKGSLCDDVFYSILR